MAVENSTPAYFDFTFARLNEIDAADATLAGLHALFKQSVFSEDNAEHLQMDLLFEQLGLRLQGLRTSLDRATYDYVAKENTMV